MNLTEYTGVQDRHWYFSGPVPFDKISEVCYTIIHSSEVSNGFGKTGKRFATQGQAVRRKWLFFISLKQVSNIE